MRDIRKQPVRIAGYSISSRRDGSALNKGVERWRVHIRIDREAFLDLRDFYLDAALRTPRVELEGSLNKVRFEPYAPIRRQLLSVLGQVNRRRKACGLQPLRSSCLRFRRRPVRPFDPPAANDDGRVGWGFLLLIVAAAVAWRYDLLPWALGALLVLVVHRRR